MQHATVFTKFCSETTLKGHRIVLLCLVLIICQTHVFTPVQIYGFDSLTLTFHIFGSFNAMKTKIPRSIQCNNMSSFIAIVLVDVNIIAIYEL